MFSCKTYFWVTAIKCTVICKCIFMNGTCSTTLKVTQFQKLAHRKTHPLNGKLTQTLQHPHFHRLNIAMKIIIIILYI